MLEHGTKVGALPVGSVDDVESDQNSFIVDPLVNKEQDVDEKSFIVDVLVNREQDVEEKSFILDPLVNKEQELAVVDQVTNGTVDFRGRPAIRSKSGKWKACWLIFGCEVCERVAFYSISANLTMHLQEALHEPVSVSARNVNNWVGTTFLTPLLGAFVADSFAGRYWTIATFSCGYFVALAMVVMSITLPSLKPESCDILMDENCFKAKPSPFKGVFFYMALYLMAIGAGGIKSCVAGFAGDQFDEGDRKEAKGKNSFMNWWFVSISFGTMCSVSFLVYIQLSLGLFYGWGIPALLSAVTTTAFLLGTPLYRHRKPTGSPFVRIAQVLVAAARKCFVKLPHDEDLLYEIDDKEALDPNNRKLPHTKDFTFLDKAAVPGAEAAHYSCRGVKPDPWKLCTVTQVEEVKLLIRLLPIWITNLMFSAVFAQVGTLFLNQGSTMERRIESIGFQIPAASFPLFVTLTICCLLPLYDRFFVPFVRKFTGEEQGITLLQRIGVGQLVSTLSITVAAFVEMKRMAVAKRFIFDNGISLGSSAALNLPMSIFWLTPQYMLVGASEVFISVGQMEFFYSQVPDSMRSVGAALYLSTVAVGSFVSSLLVTIVTKVTMNSNGGWIGNDLSRSHIDYFYWLLATLSLVNFSIYALCAKWYKYKNIPGRSTTTSSFTSPDATVDSKKCIQFHAPPSDCNSNGLVKHPSDHEPSHYSGNCHTDHSDGD